MDDITKRKLPYKIMLDRYCQKDLKKKLEPGTIVVATVDESNPLYPQKEVCKVREIEGRLIHALNLFDDGKTEYTVDLDKLEVPTETHPAQLWSRVSNGNASNEMTHKQDYWQQEFYWMLEDWKFVPGGRILAMMGSSNQDSLTAFNCFVIPSPHDSRHGALDSLDNMIEIMSRGGGVGINISSLRPRHAIVRGVCGTSSGAVSWGGGYSYYTGLIEQGGSRRGALLEGLAVWHPDIFEFIDIKKTPGEMSNANLSVLVTEDFMYAVENNLDWDLRFPDTSYSAYEKEWDGNLKKWESKGYPVIKYRTIKAKELWDKIIESNWQSGEPGIIWIERYNALSNSWYFEEIIATNPCGEQGLPPWGVCNLGHVNLSKIPLDASCRWGINWGYLGKVVRYGVRFLDNVIDLTSYFFEENKKKQKSTRRIGMGTMGLAELLINLGIKYGSDECTDFLHDLYSFIRNEAYDESCELAIEKGCFPEFDPEQFLKGEFIKNLPDPLKSKIRKHGIRNVAILTQAPTGSTGTMCETSTGVEPFFSWVYKRSGRLGTELQVVDIAFNYLKQSGIEPDPENIDKQLPSFFVNAQNLTPLAHIKVMSTIQQYVDSSISKTVNCPNDTTIEELDDLYRYAYASGCKGLTTYRDKCRESQVLNTIDKKEAPKKTSVVDKIKTMTMEELHDASIMETSTAPKSKILPKPKDTIYRLVKFYTGCGRIKLMIGTAKSAGNKVVDIYTIVNSEGGCQLNIQGIAITISRYLRMGGDIEELLENAEKSGNCASYQFQRGKGVKAVYGKSCFHGIIKAIVEFQKGILPDFVEVEGPAYEGPDFSFVQESMSVPEALEKANRSFEKFKEALDKVELKEVAESLDKAILSEDDKNDPSICPVCKSQMLPETGCWQCKQCGYSKCE